MSNILSNGITPILSFISPILNLSPLCINISSNFSFVIGQVNSLLFIAQLSNIA